MANATEHPATDKAAHRRTGPHADKLLRRCIVTGETQPRASLIRFVVGPDNQVVPDLAGRLPGRGLWLSPSRRIVNRACATKAFARVARRPVKAQAGLDDLVEVLLVRRLQECVGLARRAGQAVAGFEKVRVAAASGPLRALLIAADAGSDARVRHAGIARRVPGDTTISIGCMTAAEMGTAFGRDRAVHACIRPGTLAERLISDAEKLSGFRDAAPDTDRNDEAVQRS